MLNNRGAQPLRILYQITRGALIRRRQQTRWSLARSLYVVPIQHNRIWLLQTRRVFIFHFFFYLRGSASRFAHDNLYTCVHVSDRLIICRYSLFTCWPMAIYINLQHIDNTPRAPPRYMTTSSRGDCARAAGPEKGARRDVVVVCVSRVEFVELCFVEMYGHRFVDFSNYTIYSYVFIGLPWIGAYDWRKRHN